MGWSHTNVDIIPKLLKYKSLQINSMDTHSSIVLNLGSDFGYINKNSFSIYSKIIQHVAMCKELHITCNEVVDDGIGALVGVHSSSYVPHHCTWRGVLRHCQQLIRQAAALRYIHVHTQTHTYTDKDQRKT